MTQEEKAQAYDEALNKAKIEISTKGIGETVNLCYQLFPQLAESEDEENEDEKTRKFLIQHISEWIGCIEHDLKYSSKDIESEKELAMFKAGLAYLEKQKKCVAGSSKTSADEAEMIIEGFKGLLRGIKEKGGLTLNMVSIEKCEAWLEKQKENPKSADSIPVDCTAGAKCEDRWHKVEDSLPDNPREVLCKDEARNYFIGRYYAGEGWEISNYDDEDKPHHLNPPVSKWIDFPSEKQKEQKEETLRDFIDNFPYSAEQKEQKPIECIEFDNEFEKQVSHLLASVLNGEWEYNEGFVKYAAQSLLGYAKHELKQELPLMGGDTDTYFDDLRMTTKPLTSREWFDEGIKYAQRLQKEQKHNYCLYGGDPSVGRCRWCSAACSARLADVHTDEEKEYIRTIKSIISDFIRDKKPENLAYYQRIYDWLDGRHVPFSCGHENGEPADHVFSKQEYESHPIISKDTTSVKPVEFDGKTLLYTADKSYQIGFRDGVASVKQEWNKEDEEMRDTCIDLLEHFPRPCGEVIGPWKDCIAWLKSLRPQSQGIYQQVVKGLRNMCDRYEQNGMFTDERARDFLGNVRVKCKDAIECAPILDEPSWKPSKEQMSMLLAVINDPNNAGAESCYMALKSIYNNLKKL